MYVQPYIASYSNKKPDTDRMCMNSDIDTNSDMDARHHAWAHSHSYNGIQI